MLNKTWIRARERLFIEAAGERNVDQVFSQETLEPMLKALLLLPVWKNAEPNLKKAEIAGFLINVGFQYLVAMQKKHITRSHKRTIDDN